MIILVLFIFSREWCVKIVIDGYEWLSLYKDDHNQIQVIQIQSQDHIISCSLVVQK